MQRYLGRTGADVIFAMLVTTGAAVVALCAAALVMPDATHDTVFLENGPVETASAVLWVLLAVLLLALVRPISPAVAAGAVVALASAAREMDLHKNVTGYSVLKPGFYLKPEFELHHQVIAGLLVALLGVSAAVLLRRLATLLRHAPRPWPAWTLGLAQAFAVLVVSKVLDRAPAILRDDMDIRLSDHALDVGIALEEGLELLVPVWFAAVTLSFFLHARARRPDTAPRAV
jgi:hypothetical protein